MSRYNPRHSTDAFIKAAEHWKKHCFLADGALLSSAAYWNTSYLDELDQCFSQNPIDGHKSYLDKLKVQLSETSPEAIKLMTELNWLLLVFSTNIKPDTKRELLLALWELTGEALPSSWLLDDATLAGVGSTGTGYNTLRWLELTYLINVMQAFKSLPQQERTQKLASPWDFADWLETLKGSDKRQFRHILCFLLFPEDFEHTSVGSDKKTMLQVLANMPKSKLKSMNHSEVDRSLLELRQQLEQQEGSDIDFHSPPWVERWRPSESKNWLMVWNPKNFPWDSFQDDRLRVARGESVTLRWTTSSKQLKEGDTAYLIRIGEDPKGLIARGTITKEPYKEEHYLPDRAEQGETATYVDITLTDLRDPKAEPYISLAYLKADTVDDQQWTPQSSGIEIKPRSAKLVSTFWNQLPPVKVNQSDAPTPRQEAIVKINKPVNQIFYGPPGTGKTHHWRTHLQPKYENQASQVTTGEWLEDQLANTAWWETIALALADQTEKGAGGTVNDLLIHPFFKAKARIQGRSDSPNLRSTCWNLLQGHTVLDSTTVNFAREKRQSPLIFDKKPGGHWVLTGDWEEAGEGLRQQLKKLQQGPQSADTRIKRHLTVTFHQSYSYEDFIEGIRPLTTEEGLSYEVCDGLFKQICNRARQDPTQRYALFVDEINRGNISRIFGELITLIEADKRAWWNEEGQLVQGIEMTLPYSKEPFGVPKNLDIYATMNTADRSIALMDAALRRRFRFIEILPEPKQIPGNQGDGSIPDGEGGQIYLRPLLEAINLRLRYLLHRDQTFGHAYFMEIKDLDQLRAVMVYDIIPMLSEYFYNDWQQIQRVLVDDCAPAEHQIITSQTLDPARLFSNMEMDLPEKSDYRVKQPHEITADALKKIYENIGD